MFFSPICLFFVLHADKAKGLQINLSEALQGKNHKIFLVTLSLLLTGLDLRLLCQ